jgi:hypothetical protein
MNSFLSKIFIFFLSQIFFTAGHSKKLNSLSDKNIKKIPKNERLFNRFEIIFSGLKKIHDKKITSFEQIMKNKEFDDFKSVISETSIQNFKKDFFSEIDRLNLLNLAFNVKNIFYIDNGLSLFIQNKIPKSSRKITIFHCCGRDGLTIDEEEYYLELSSRINCKNYDIEHFWLNMPSKPSLSDDIADFQFKIIKNIIYVKSLRLENIILSGFSLGGIISLKILEKFKNDNFFSGQKLMAYVNIASFSGMVEILSFLRPFSKNHIIPCKILNILGKIIEQNSNEEFLKNWEVDLIKILDETKEIVSSRFICGLEFDEFVPSNCSSISKIINNKDIIEDYDIFNLEYKINIKKFDHELLCLEFKNFEKKEFNHENCRGFFIEIILNILLKTEKQNKFIFYENRNFFEKIFLNLKKKIKNYNIIN